MKRILAFVSLHCMLMTPLGVCAITHGENHAIEPLVLNTKIIPHDAESMDNFGFAMAMNGDHMLIGAVGHDDVAVAAGAVYHYQLIDGSWQFNGFLQPTGLQQNDQFGFRIVMNSQWAMVTSRDGTTFGNSAPGSVYVFEYDGQNWVESQKLSYTDLTDDSEDDFGRSLALSDDYLVVGSTSGDGQLVSGGLAHVYELLESGWTETKVLSASDETQFGEFGNDVAVNGNRIMVGGIQMPNESGITTGAAYVFENQGAGWVETQKLIASDGHDFGAFGTRTELLGDIAVVTDRWAKADNGDLWGAVYVYTHNGLQWELNQKLMPDELSRDDQFGASVSIRQDRMIVAARSHMGSGAAFVYEPDNGQWMFRQKIIPADADVLDAFGGSVQSAEHVLITDSRSDNVGNNSGSVYLYHLDLIFADDFSGSP